MRGRKLKTPNLLIIGAQKSGTSWLHRALNQSKFLSGSQPKELNYWNRMEGISFDEYCECFRPGRRSVRFWFESTPVYFQKPRGRVNIARNIREKLGDIPLLVMLRDPTERYLSAYTHHMLKGRIPQQKVVSNIDDTFKMLSLGRYGEIMEHYQSHFSKIYVHLYDDLKVDSFKLVQNVMQQLDLECDLTPGDIDFRANAKDLKAAKAGWDTDFIPELSTETRKQLNEYYRQDVQKLSSIIGRDLEKWLT
jgi:hypothetical protein